MAELNSYSLKGLCAALCQVMGVEPPAYAEAPDERLLAFVKEMFGDKKLDRLVMYNPDAVAEWIMEKYHDYVAALENGNSIKMPFCTVMPSVTPVCFATMYTGALPEVHGICKYERPVLEIDTMFDAFARAGKRVALIASPRCSIGMIFLNRDIDYYLVPSVAEANAKGAQLILEDQYDFILIYNGNYDYVMHKTGPESMASIAELRANVYAYTTFCEMVREHWQGHNTLIGFAMDHGCHEIDGDAGSHGLDMPEDLNICHVYRAYPAQK